MTTIRRSVQTAALVASILLAFAAVAQAAPGDIDVTYSRGGRHITDFARAPDAAHAVLVLPDGKLRLAGIADANGSVAGGNHFGLVPYTLNGDRDGTFGDSGPRGGGGKVVTTFGTYDAAHAIAPQSDGNFVVAGITLSGPQYQFALVRFLPNGSLDPAFGTGGKVITSLAQGLTNTAGHAVALVIQTDGRLVVAGTSGGDFVLVRLNPNGSIDQSFGSGGTVTTDFGFVENASALVLQPDGKLVAAGSSVGGPALADFVLARYSSDGTLDQSFGVEGKVRTDFGLGLPDTLDALVLQPDGRLVAAGSAFVVDTQDGADFALARYNSDGTPDDTFGGGGLVSTAITARRDGAHGLVVQGDKLVAAGHAFVTSSNTAFAVARYNILDGSLDPTFSTDGKLTDDFIGSFGYANAVALQGGKIIVVGSSVDNFASARYFG